METWRWDKVLAWFAAAMMAVGVVFSGGGHGWGSQLIYWGFWPTVPLFWFVDGLYRSSICAGLDPLAEPCQISRLYSFAFLLSGITAAILQYWLIGYWIRSVQLQHRARRPHLAVD
jgi:hypothetical protein